MEPFVTLIDSIPFWGWFVLAIALIAAEVVLPTTHMLWPAAGAVVTGVLVLVLGDPFPAWQVAAFAVPDGGAQLVFQLAVVQCFCPGFHRQFTGYFLFPPERLDQPRG